jgi:NTE family protein
VLAPITAGFGPVASVADQVRELRTQAQVAVVSPDRAARQAFGRNVLDPARRAPAARAGRDQAPAAATAVAAVWSGVGEPEGG